MTTTMQDCQEKMHNNSVIILADKAGEEFVYAVVWKFY